MKGILILAHGSRRRETEDTLSALARKVREMTGVEALETAFLQFSDTTLWAGLDKLCARGCTEIVLIPYFLFDGVHIREDIPAEIEQYVKAHEAVSVRMGRTLGADDRLAQIVADQVKEAFGDR